LKTTRKYFAVNTSHRRRDYFLVLTIKRAVLGGNQMDIGKNKRHEVLVSGITDARAESLVTDWANTTTEYPVDAARPFSEATKLAIARSDAAIERLARRYPEVFSDFPAVPPSPADRDSNIATTHWFIMAKIQRFLRLAWDAPTLRECEWHLFTARAEFHSSTGWAFMWEQRLRESSDLPKAIQEGLTPEEDAVQVSVPDLTPFEQAFYHLHRIAKRMRHCRNSECPAPYFLAKKKGQKYCSSKCSAPMQRQQKLKWWRENRDKRSN
jgi:hypothetical protein